MTLQSLDNSLEEIKPSCSRTNTESDSDDGDSSLPELKLAKILDVVQSKKVPVQAQYNTINQSSDVKFGDEWHLHFHGVKITGEASDKPSSRSSEEIPVSNLGAISHQQIPAAKIPISRAVLRRKLLKPIKRHCKLSIIILSTVAVLCITALVTITITATTRHDAKEPSATSTTPAVVQPPQRHILKRASWGARAPSEELPELPTPVKLVTFTQTSRATCQDLLSCFTAMQDLQNSDVGNHGLPDIRYNFVVGGDGNVYEGRGWTMQNNHRDDSLEVAYMGDFSPGGFVMLAGLWLVDQGIAEGHVSSEFQAFCLNRSLEQLCNDMSQID